MRRIEQTGWAERPVGRISGQPAPRPGARSRPHVGYPVCESACLIHCKRAQAARPHNPQPRLTVLFGSSARLSFSLSPPLSGSAGLCKGCEDCRKKAGGWGAACRPTSQREPSRAVILLWLADTGSVAIACNEGGIQMSLEDLPPAVAPCQRGSPMRSQSSPLAAPACCRGLHTPKVTMGRSPVEVRPRLRDSGQLAASGGGRAENQGGVGPTKAKAV